MYQITINLSTKYLYWFYAVESELKKEIMDFAIMANTFKKDRCYYAFACENINKSKLNETLKKNITKILSKESKYTFFDERINLPIISKAEKNLLISALVGFDSEQEIDEISNSFFITDGLCIDGIYNFRLKSLKERWNEVLQLTVDNSIFLSDKDIFYEVIKFLFSSIKPKINKIYINMDNGAYLMHSVSNGKRIRVAYDEEQLLCSLIEYAPIEIYFKEDIRQNGTINKLSKLFNFKEDSKNNILI